MVGVWGRSPSGVQGQSPWSGGHSCHEAEKKFYPNGKYVLKILLNGQSVGGDIYLCVPQPKCWGRVPPCPYNRRPWPVYLVGAVPSYAAVRSPHRHPVLTTDTSHVVHTGVSTWHQLLYPTTADDASRLVFDVVEKKQKEIIRRVPPVVVEKNYYRST